MSRMLLYDKIQLLYWHYKVPKNDIYNILDLTPEMYEAIVQKGRPGSQTMEIDHKESKGVLKL